MQFNGLTMKQVKDLQARYGRNEIRKNNKGKVITKIKHIIDEPIYLLLLSAAIIYFFLGEASHGVIMIAFVIFVVGIDMIQEMRAGVTLKRIKDISTPKIKVIREGQKMMIRSVELVPGDIMFISEGVKIPADGSLIYTNGLCVDESILTGESEGVWKSSIPENLCLSRELPQDDFFRRDYCYTGTLVILGDGVIKVEKTGNDTEYGKIADKIIKAPLESTLLQKQLKKLAKQCTYIAAVLFLLVSTVTFFHRVESSLITRLVESFLAGVVLALSMVPGEFPVIQSVFLSMGALRLAKKNALIRTLSAVETLGAVSVLCVDKTGTITNNRMKVQEFWTLDGIFDSLCRALILSCKENTYDPMEVAMLDFCSLQFQKGKDDVEYVKACMLSNQHSAFLREYAFTNELKAMGQVWKFTNRISIAVKGSPETIIPLCMLSEEQMLQVDKTMNDMLKKGLRVIAVADCNIKNENEIPDSLTECKLYLKGVVGLTNPPKENIDEQLRMCYKAGIRIIMITGDHPLTAVTVAKSIGIHNPTHYITGDEITKMSDDCLRKKVMEYNIFARVLPLHKMRIVKALKDNGEVTAMTGDGVNDSPALKIADIGVAMGKYGSEVSREAADLVLLDDNFSTILDSVCDGRRIYQNIRKAVGYTFAVHIPIALLSLIIPLLNISPRALLLLPLHIVLLELIMDPTCSFALERLPAEGDIMNKAPRDPNESIFNGRLLLKSVLQGIMVFAGSFYLYYGLLRSSFSPEVARTAGYGVLVLANIFLVITNSSDSESIFKILNKLKKEKGVWIVNLVTLTELLIMVYSPLAKLLKFSPLPTKLFILMVMVSAFSVFWYEFYKLIKRRKERDD